MDTAELNPDTKKPRVGRVAMFLLVPPDTFGVRAMTS
jgi:hypothetical protein